MKCTTDLSPATPRALRARAAADERPWESDYPTNDVKELTRAKGEGQGVWVAF
jgi:hypothetical protein